VLFAVHLVLSARC